MGTAQAASSNPFVSKRSTSTSSPMSRNSTEFSTSSMSVQSAETYPCVRSLIASCGARSPTSSPAATTARGPLAWSFWASA